MSRPSSYHPSQYNEDPFDANGFALPLFNAPQPPSIPQITTDLATNSPYDTPSSARFPPPSAGSSQQHRHSVSHALASPFSASSPQSAGPPPANRHHRQGSMSSALPYTSSHSGQGVPYPQSARMDGAMMMPPQAGGVSSLGSLARSASLGRKKDPYSYSSDDVESGLGSMDMGGGPTWPGYGARATQHQPPPPMPQTSRDVIMSPNRPSSNNPMNPPPVPSHVLSRPPQQRYNSGGSSPSAQHSSQAQRESISNPYVPRGVETSPSDSNNGQWTDYRRPPSNRMPSASSYSAHSPASDQQQMSSPYLRPDMIGTSPNSPMPNPYELSPNASTSHLPSSPMQGSQWPTLDTSMPVSPAFSRSMSNQTYPASQPTTPAKGYESGGYRPNSQNREERSAAGPSAGFRDVRDRKDLKPNTRGLNQGRRADPNAPGKYLSVCHARLLTSMSVLMIATEMPYDGSPRNVLAVQSRV